LPGFGKNLYVRASMREKTRPTGSGTATNVAHEPVDLRSHARYRLEAPVLFSWEDHDGSQLQGGGFTRDLSATGAFILSRASPPKGVSVRLEILLPPLKGKGHLTMFCDGRVVRLDQALGEKRGGFAAVCDGFAILG
jgi:PilZ domain